MQRLSVQDARREHDRGPAALLVDRRGHVLADTFDELRRNRSRLDFGRGVFAVAIAPHALQVDLCRARKSDRRHEPPAIDQGSQPNPISDLVKGRVVALVQIAGVEPVRCRRQPDRDQRRVALAELGEDRLILRRFTPRDHVRLVDDGEAEERDRLRSCEALDRREHDRRVELLTPEARSVDADRHARKEPTQRRRILLDELPDVLQAHDRHAFGDGVGDQPGDDDRLARSGRCLDEHARDAALKNCAVDRFDGLLLVVVEIQNGASGV